MLSNAIMGVFALSVLWVNTLLVIGAALQRFRAIARRRARLAPIEPRVGAEGLLVGKLGPSANREDGVVARATIEQLGRFGAGEARTILWHDRRYGSEVFGGTLSVGGEVLALGAGDPAEVWPTVEAVESAAQCTSLSTFDAAFEKARKAKGVSRTVEVPLREGRDVFVFGEIVDGPDGLVVRGTPEAPLLVSAIDPRVWCARKMLFLGALFVPAVLLAASIATALALTPPHFGTVSMIGGGLGFLYFLLVLPAGTAARDAVREPHLRILRGRWIDPAGARAASTKPATSSAS